MNSTNKNETNHSFSIITPQDLQFDVKHDVDSVAFSIWIRALHQNWRQGTVGCKTRSEVAFSNRKPWKQKGTGRARAGSLRSPLWRKGGIIFGPQARVRTLKVNKDIKKRVLNNLLWNFLDNKKAFLLDWQMGEKPRTADAFEMLKKNNLDKSKIVLLIDKSDFLAQATFANLQNVKILLFDQINAFDLSSSDTLVLFKKDLNLFKDTVIQWI